MIGDLFGMMDKNLGESLSNLLNKFAKMSNSKFVITHMDEKIQYTIKEMQLLRLVSDREDLKNIEVAESLGVTKGMVSKMIKQLKGNGVIEKKPNPDNAREIQLNITDLGRAHLASFSSMFTTKVFDIYQIWLDIPSAERDKFKKIMGLYTEILDIIDTKN